MELSILFPANHLSITYPLRLATEKAEFSINYQQAFFDNFDYPNPRRLLPKNSENREPPPCFATPSCVQPATQQSEPQNQNGPFKRKFPIFHETHQRTRKTLKHPKSSKKPPPPSPPCPEKTETLGRLRDSYQCPTRRNSPSSRNRIFRM